MNYPPVIRWLPTLILILSSFPSNCLSAVIPAVSSTPNVIVIGFVGGFAQGLLEAPIESAVKGAWDCLDGD